MLERLVARVPALLLAGAIALAAYVAFAESDDPQRALSAAPAALVLIAYLRAGRGGRK